MIIQLSKKELMAIELAVRLRRQACEENAHIHDENEKAKEWRALEEKIMRILSQSVKKSP